MKLRDYIHFNRIKKVEFAAKIGVSPSRITQLCEEKAPWPKRDLARRIFEATDGQVTANDFINLEQDVQP
jgi:3,4-dihydroxy 2-butanone 4-phosphate synthase/GTP cyclohydrolase II